MPSGCNAVRVYAIKTSESRLLGVKRKKERERWRKRGKAEEGRRERRRARKREVERRREGEGERESKGTDGPGRGKRYNPISCTINRPSGHPTAQLQHISAGRTKDGFSGPHQTCLSITILEPGPQISDQFGRPLRQRGENKDGDASRMSIHGVIGLQSGF